MFLVPVRWIPVRWRLQMSGGVSRCPAESPDIRRSLKLSGARPLAGHHECLTQTVANPTPPTLAEMWQNVRRSWGPKITPGHRKNVCCRVRAAKSIGNNRLRCIRILLACAEITIPVDLNCLSTSGKIANYKSIGRTNINISMPNKRGYPESHPQGVPWRVVKPTGSFSGRATVLRSTVS